MFAGLVCNPDLNNILCSHGVYPTRPGLSGHWKIGVLSRITYDLIPIICDTPMYFEGTNILIAIALLGREFTPMEYLL
jgi:hypothetical protein